MNAIKKECFCCNLDLPYTPQPTVMITRGEDVTIKGIINDVDLTEHQISTQVLTRDISVTGYSFDVIKAPDQNLEDNKGRFTLTLSRAITEELKQNEYFCYVYIVDINDKLSIPESLKIMMRMLDNINPAMIPIL